MEPLECRVLLSAATAARPPVSQVVDGLRHTMQILSNYPAGPASVVGNQAAFATLYPSVAFDIYNSDTGSWSTTRFHGTAPASIATVAGNEAIFASDLGSAVEIYHADGRVWTITSLSVIGNGMATTSVRDKALFTGGFGLFGPFSPSAEVNIYNTKARAWSTASLSQARGYVTAATVGDYAIFAGGDTYMTDYGPLNPSTVVDIYDEATGRWSTATLSAPRAGMGVAVVGDKAVFAGGWVATSTASNTTVASAAVDIFDSGTGRWSRTTLPAGSGDPAVGTVGDKAFFALGGSSYGTPSDIVEIYNARTGKWTTSHLSVARTGISATCLDGKVIFAGGYTVDARGNAIASSVADIYDTATRKWSTASVVPADDPGVGLGTAVTVGSEAVVVGGNEPFGYQHGVVDTFTNPSLKSHRSSAVSSRAR